MSDLLKYARPHHEHDPKRAVSQERPRRRSGVPRWALIAMGLLVGGIIGQILTSNMSLQEVEQHVADAIDMLRW